MKHSKTVCGNDSWKQPGDSDKSCVKVQLCFLPPCNSTEVAGRVHRVQDPQGQK